MNKEIRLPSEWEAADAVLMAWPHAGTDWAYMLDDVRRCYADIIAACAARAKVIIVGPEAPEDKYLPTGDVRDNIIYIDVPTNDTWTRDYGPITTVASDGRMSLNDFCFNGWGLKFAADRDNLVTTVLSRTGIFAAERTNRLGFVLEGGSIESDGRGTILTTTRCLMSPNRNGDLTIEQISKYLAATLGTKQVIWLSAGALEGDDTDSHIDTLARFAPPGDVIFYTGCHDESDPHYAELQRMARQLSKLQVPGTDHPYHLIELPLPDAVYDPDDDTRLPATYANFLILNGAVLLPVYGQPMKDLQARMAIQAAMPDYEVVSVDCRALIRQHGSLHCATMQLPAGSLNI